MTLPSYSSTGLSDNILADSWQSSNAYLDPVATDMESGNKRLRRQPGDDVQLIQFSMLYTLSQYNTFKTWVNTFRGIGRFTMNVYDGVSKTSRTVQFEKPYEVMSVPPTRVQVNFNLRVFP